MSSLFPPIRPALIFILVIGACGLCSADTAADEVPEILARWNGGELSRDDFRSRYDWGSAALEADRERLDAALRRAVFMEIYQDFAAKSELAESPDFVAYVEQWSNGVLGELFCARGELKIPAEVGDEEASAYYEEHKDRQFTFPGTADLGVLFVRCARDEEARAECRQHIAELQERVLISEHPGKLALESVIFEERERSGPANGFFRRLALSQLAPNIAEAVLTTPVGSYTPVLETPVGLFWLWVENRREPVISTFEDARGLIDDAIRDQRALDWRTAEALRLRAEMGDAAEGLSDSQVFSVAAKAAGMNMDPEFLQRRSLMVEQRLPMVALEGDTGIAVDDRQLHAMLDQNPARARGHRRYWVVLAVAEPQKEPYAAHKVAEEISRRLVAPASPAETLRGLRGELEHVSVYDLGPLSFGEIRVVNQRVGEAVSDLADGSWKGPLVLKNPLALRVVVGDPGDLPQLTKGLGFVTVERSEMPPMDEIRERMQAEYRRMLLQNHALFDEVFAARWGLQLFPQAEPAEVGTPD